MALLLLSSPSKASFIFSYQDFPVLICSTAIEHLDTTGSHSAVIEKAVPVITRGDIIKRATVMVPVTVSNDSDDDSIVASDSTDATATTCVHTDDGFIQCGEVMSTRDTVTTSSTDKISKRGEMILPRNIPMKRTSFLPSSPSYEIEPQDHLKTHTEGFPDISGQPCSPKGFHFVQHKDPGYCWEINKENPNTEKYSELYRDCYSKVPCGQDTPNDFLDPLNPLATVQKRQDAGCHAKMTDLYFKNPPIMPMCNQELIKGSVKYKNMYPGVEWDVDTMAMCFVSAGCDGGDEFDSGDE